MILQFQVTFVLVNIDLTDASLEEIRGSLLLQFLHLLLVNSCGSNTGFGLDAFWLSLCA